MIQLFDKLDALSNRSLRVITLVSLFFIWVFLAAVGVVIVSSLHWWFSK